MDLGTYGSDKRCDGFSGADCAALVREAAVAAVTEFFDSMQDDDDARDTTRDPPTVRCALVDPHVRSPELQPPPPPPTPEHSRGRPSDSTPVSLRCTAL